MGGVEFLIAWFIIALVVCVPIGKLLKRIFGD
jgi:hypothetical protein